MPSSSATRVREAERKSSYKVRNCFLPRGSDTMSSISRRPWIKRWVGLLNRPWAETPRRPRRQTARPTVEQLESRLLLSADPPGHYGGANVIWSSNHEWTDTTGIYYIDPNLTVASG